MNVPHHVMERVYEEARTPYKVGIVLRAEEGGLVDCPSVFRHGQKWYMMYVGMGPDKTGYETYLAESDDLLVWRKRGVILPHRGEGVACQGVVRRDALGLGTMARLRRWLRRGSLRRRKAANEAWDAWQADGGIALQDPLWGGSYRLGTHNDKYWLSYIGGALKGYEPDPLSIGLAWTLRPDEPIEWNRLGENPVLGPKQPDARAFETRTLYKSNILRDESLSVGHPLVMFYNGKTFDEKSRHSVERIGMAVSDDMVHWRRFGDGPVIDNGKGISGDPQVVRMADWEPPLWVMFYFGAFWGPFPKNAFDTFACSYDLVNWTKWEGPPLIEPSEPYDATFAHKPWIVQHEGVVYHFYCAVGDQGRQIALATSRDMRA